MTTDVKTGGGKGWDDSIQHALYLAENELDALAAICADAGTYVQGEHGARLERAAAKIDAALGKIARQRLLRQLSELPTHERKAA